MKLFYLTIFTAIQKVLFVMALALNLLDSNILALLTVIIAASIIFLVIGRTENSTSARKTEKKTKKNYGKGPFKM